MKPYVAIAPMEGVVDWILRELLCGIGGLDKAVTEFVRVTDKVLPESVFLRYAPELARGGQTRSGVPVYVQLLGGIPEWLALNAEVAEQMGAPGIDLNFGCPAKTVNRHDGGATLLKNPRRLYDVITAVRGRVQIPVTAKVRLGFENKELCLDIAKACSDAGAASLTIHARTRNEGYVPPAHWEYIARMREVATIPLISNGEIWSKSDYQACAQIGGGRDVALGRGLVGRPDLARQIRDDVPAMTWPELVKNYILPFFSMSLEDRGERFATARLKQLLKFMSRNFVEARAAFDEVKSAHLVSEFKRPLEEACLEFKFTPGPTAPTAFAQKIS